MTTSAIGYVAFALNIVCPVVILIHGLFQVINHMTKHTAFFMRLAWLLLTTGALALLLSPWFGVQFGWGTSFLVWGFAAYILADKRDSVRHCNILRRHE